MKNLLQFSRKVHIVFLSSILYVYSVAGQPIISSFLPNSGVPGTTVTINGTGFSSTISENIVLFNTIRASISLATTNSLIISVPNGATYGPITVISLGLVAYSATSFSISYYPTCTNLNTGSFSTKQDFGTANNPESICTGDLDTDGYPDIITANGSVNNISILRNSGSGLISFDTKLDIATTSIPTKVIINDLDGDGKPDIIVSDKFSSSISVFRNLSTPGFISFAPKINFNTASNPIDIVAVDINADGKMDLAIANNNSNSISLLKNLSSIGTIIFATKIDFTTGNLRPKSLSSGDFNLDGKPDIAVASYSALHDSVSIFKNTSTVSFISFASRLNFLNEGGAYNIITADVDQDNNPDIVVANYSLSVISIFRNSGTGTIAFEPRLNFVSGINPQGLSTGDFNGDGKPDLITSNISVNTVSVLLNNGSPGNISFNPKVDYASGTYPSAVSLADFDLNGRPDISVSNTLDNTISIIRKHVSQKIFLVDSSKITNSIALGLCTMNINDWANACNNLQTALNEAQDGDQIWVAKGTYFPSQDSTGNSNPSNPNMLTFVMKSGVKIYGGFSGFETSMIQANISLNETILNGQIDINGNLIKVGNVIWYGQVKNAILHGFRIKNGNAANGFKGGGIYINMSYPVISNCIIHGNSSNNSGGGIYMNNSKPILINCSIYENTAPYGAAITNINSTPAIINCTITKNNAASAGGGIFNQASSPIISNSIIWGNSGFNNLIDNINSSTGTPIVSYSYIGQLGSVFPGTGNKNVNPLFVDALNANFSLLSRPTSITSGNLNAYPSYAPLTDLLGNARIVNGTINIGAYQEQKSALLNSVGIIYVDSSTSTIFGNGRSWSTAYSALSDAMVVSNTNNNVSALWVAKGTYIATYDSALKPNPIEAHYVTFALKRGTKLLGGFSGTENDVEQRNTVLNQTILNGLLNENGSPTKVVNVIYVFNSDSVNLIDGFTITNGKGDNIYGGGGIYLKSSKLTVSNCSIVNNLGPGIDNWYGNLFVSNCYFSGNSAQFGNAINNSNSNNTVISGCNFFNNISMVSSSSGGAIANLNSTVTISHSDFTNNQTLSNGGGGAIYSKSSTMTVKNCRFTGNHPINSGVGGAISNVTNCNTSFINCSFIKNFAGQGGAIANHSSIASIINCSITNNSASYNGGIINFSTATTTIKNTISWGNKSIYNSGSGNNVYDGNINNHLSASFNISNSIIGLPSGIYPGTDNLNINPQFSDTANGIIKLLYNSPAIDAGNNSSYTGNLNTDQDIYGMFRLSGSKIDIGASEFFVNACQGGSTTFTSNLTGSNYQWQIDSGSGFNNLVDNGNISGSSTAVLQVVNLLSSWNEYKFRCVVNGTPGNITTLRIYNQWLGNFSKLWEDVLNWSCNILPDNNTNLLINTGEIEINSNAICYSLNIYPGIKITIRPGATLTVFH